MILHSTVKFGTDELNRFPVWSSSTSSLSERGKPQPFLHYISKLVVCGLLSYGRPLQGTCREQSWNITSHEDLKMYWNIILKVAYEIKPPAVWCFWSSVSVLCQPSWAPSPHWKREQRALDAGPHHPPWLRPSLRDVTPMEKSKYEAILSTGEEGKSVTRKCLIEVYKMT